MSITTWILVSVICFILELFQPGIFISCFGVGALVTGLLSPIIESTLIELVMFACVSGLSVIFLRPIIHNMFGKKNATNVERLIGQKAVVTARISQGAHGFVKLGSETWMAKADEDIAKGRIVTVESVSGATLRVRLFVEEDNDNTDIKEENS